MQLRIAIFVVTALLVGAMKYVSVSSSLPKLGYRVHILSVDGREIELVGGIVCLLFWCGLFAYDLIVPTISIVDPRIFTLLIGWMAGICISTIYTVKFMPRGFYEKGILTENKAIYFENIGSHTVTPLKKKNYKRYTFYLENDTKHKYNLFVGPKDQKKINTLIRQNKIQ